MRRSLHFNTPNPLTGQTVLELCNCLEAMLGVRFKMVQQHQDLRLLSPTNRQAILTEPEVWQASTVWSEQALDQTAEDFIVLRFFAHRGHGGPPYVTVAVDLEGNVGQGAEADILLAAGDALGAWCGSYNPPGTRLALREQVSTGPLFRHRPIHVPQGLPLISGPQFHPRLVLPTRLEWLNYWSADVAAEIGFPVSNDPWLPLAVQSSSTGAWCVRITPDPLDVTVLEHLAALASAYVRFERVGVRWAPPTMPQEQPAA